MTDQTVPTDEIPLPLRRVAARFISEGRMAALDDLTAGLRQLAAEHLDHARAAASQSDGHWELHIAVHDRLVAVADQLGAQR